MSDKNTIIIIRDSKDPSRQMQICVNYSEGSMGVAYNYGLELLVVSQACTGNVALSYKKAEEPKNASEE